MADKKKFTHPSKPGADQSTTYIQVGYGEPYEECPKAKIEKQSVSRGEDVFARYPTAR